VFTVSALVCWEDDTLSLNDVLKDVFREVVVVWAIAAVWERAISMVGILNVDDSDSSGGGKAARWRSSSFATLVSFDKTGESLELSERRFHGVDVGMKRGLACFRLKDGVGEGG
jgi:hypothetical protein